MGSWCHSFVGLGRDLLGCFTTAPVPSWICAVGHQGLWIDWSPRQKKKKNCAHPPVYLICFHFVHVIHSCAVEFLNSPMNRSFMCSSTLPNPTSIRAIIFFPCYYLTRICCQSINSANVLGASSPVCSHTNFLLRTRTVFQNKKKRYNCMLVQLLPRPCSFHFVLFVPVSQPTCSKSCFAS